MICTKTLDGATFAVAYGVQESELGVLDGVIRSADLTTHTHTSSSVAIHQRTQPANAILLAQGFNQPTLYVSEPTTNPPIVALYEQIRAIRAINQLIGIARNAATKSITLQDMIYQNKMTEATLFLADPEQSVDQFPYIKMHVEISGDSPVDVARAIQAASARDYEFAVETERIRCMHLAQVPGIVTSSDSQAIIESARSTLITLAA